ncbi:MAG: hypothetical protein ACE5H0_13305 [Bacteroidota bacterium]
MSRNINAYLSGGMEYAESEGAGWRADLHQWIEDRLGHHVFNPNEKSEEFLSTYYPGIDFRQLKRENIERFRDIVQNIVDFDCREIAQRSDYVVCFWDESAQRGAGTKGELTIAKYFGKPVYLVTAMNPAEIPGWVIGCTMRIFHSFHELKAFLYERYKQ